MNREEIKCENCKYWNDIMYLNECQNCSLRFSKKSDVFNFTIKGKE